MSNPSPGARGRHLHLAGADSSSVTPEALLRRVALGDETAFADLYDSTATMLFSIIRRVLRDRAQSEEVLQEVYLEIWQCATRFDPDRGSARAWLCAIAHRRAVDRVRSSSAARDRDIAHPGDAALPRPDIADGRSPVPRPNGCNGPSTA